MFFNDIIQEWKCPVAVGCPDSIMNPNFLNVLPDSHHIDAGWQTERLLPCFVMTGQYPAAIPSIDGQDRRNGQRRPQTSLPHADLATDRFAQLMREACSDAVERAREADVKFEAELENMARQYMAEYKTRYGRT